MSRCFIAGTTLDRSRRACRSYYEDLEDGYEQWGGEIVVDREEISPTPRVRSWPFHTDDEAAKESVFCGLVVSGGYTINLWFKQAINC